MCFEKDIADGDRAVTQEAKLPLRIELLQKDKTMIGQLHTSTYTERARDDSQLPVYYRPQCTKKTEWKKAVKLSVDMDLISSEPPKIWIQHCKPKQ